MTRNLTTLTNASTPLGCSGPSPAAPYHARYLFELPLLQEAPFADARPRQGCPPRAETDFFLFPLRAHRLSPFATKCLLAVGGPVPCHVPAAVVASAASASCSYHPHQSSLSCAFPATAPSCLADPPRDVERHRAQAVPGRPAYSTPRAPSCEPALPLFPAAQDCNFHKHLACDSQVGIAASLHGCISAGGRACWYAGPTARTGAGSRLRPRLAQQQHHPVLQTLRPVVPGQALALLR
jgi:hypothetical protein